MNVAYVMDEMASKLTAIEGLNIVPEDAEDVTSPAAMISLPTEEIEIEQYGETAVPFDVLVLVAAGTMRAARDAIGAYGSRSHPNSVIRALESSGDNEYDHCNSVTPRSIRYARVNVAGVDYVAALIRVEVDGSDEE